MTRAVELCAGGGGMALVMRDEGVDARHVEMDPDACDTLTAAGFRDVVCGDAADLATVAGLGPVDLLHGSVPCPVWSRVNTRPDRIAAAVDGWPWMLAAVRALRPTCVTVENVRGAPAEAWAADLRGEGYHARAWLLDAADFGERQTRTRWVVVASLVGVPERPQATHGDPGGPFALAPRRTLRECLDAQGERHVYPAGIGRAASDPWRLDRPAPTVTTAEAKGTRASESSGWTFHGGPDRMSDALYLALGWRRATLAECARAQGFPEGHPFRGSVEARYRQAGNAMPRTLARAALRSALGTLH